MDISVSLTPLGRDDQSWLGSAYGTNEARTVTLKFSDFTKATHYPDGYLPSGLPLTDNGDGTFGPWATTQNLDGFLFTATPVPRDGTSNVGAALLDHGRVIVAKLPIQPDATAQGTNGHFIYV